jgi:hypothetical protein
VLDDRLGQLVDGQLGVLQRRRDRLQDRLGLVGRQPDVLREGGHVRRGRGQRADPHGQVLCGQEVHGAARPERLDQGALGPQGVADVRPGDPGGPQPDGQLGGGQHLGVRDPAHGADDVGGPRSR